MEKTFMTRKCSDCKYSDFNLEADPNDEITKPSIKKSERVHEEFNDLYETFAEADGGVSNPGYLSEMFLNIANLLKEYFNKEIDAYIGDNIVKICQGVTKPSIKKSERVHEEFNDLYETFTWADRQTVEQALREYPKRIDAGSFETSVLAEAFDYNSDISKEDKRFILDNIDQIATGMKDKLKADPNRDVRYIVNLYCNLEIAEFISADNEEAIASNCDEFQRLI